MNDILHKPSVLVLNRAWQAINTRTVAEAISQLAAEAATALDISEDGMTPVKWSDWIKLPVRENDEAIHSPSLSIRVPTVIVLAHYSKVPKKRPRLCPKTIWARDAGVCQYTGRKLSLGEGNIDHVIPRSKGGQTTWENCVLADRRINSKKADKLPQDAGLYLKKTPQAPREVPVSVLIKNHMGIPDWNHFLS